MTQGERSCNLALSDLNESAKSESSTKQDKAAISSRNVEGEKQKFEQL